MNATILEKLNKIAKNQGLKVSFSQKDEKTTLRDLGLDSLAIVGMIVAMENDLSVHISNEVLAKIKTLGELVQAFEKAGKK